MVLATFLLGFSLFIFIFLPDLILPRMVDFEVNYKAGKRILWGETLYRLEDGHYQFKYPPFSSLLYLPLGLIPLSQAKFIWFVITASASLAIIIVSAQLASFPFPYPKSVPLFTFLILARFLAREISLGQINALITWILLLMVQKWVKTSKSSKDSMITGFLWGLASSLKPYSLIFLPLFLLRQSWKAIFSALFFFCLSFFTPALFYGWKGNFVVHHEWISYLKASTPPLLGSQDNISLFSLFQKWFGQNFPVWTFGFLAIIILALVVFLAVLRSKKIKDPVILESASLLLLTPLVSPLGWDYTLLSSSLAISLILYHFSLFPKVNRFFLVFILAFNGLMIFDILGRKIYSFFMKISLPTLLFLTIFAHLMWLRFSQKR